MLYTFSQIKQNGENGWSKGLVALPDFVPFSAKSVIDGVAYDREYASSDRVFDMKGEWDFCFVEGGLLSLASEKANWKKITVPGYLDEQGYGLSHKTVTRKNGDVLTLVQAVYRTQIIVRDVSKRFFLHFGKVGGIFEVLINGVSCGYSCFGSGDFDITRYLAEGENEVVVALLPAEGLVAAELMPAGYGIIGDVCLYVRPKAYLKNYSFASKKCGSLFEGSLDLVFSEESDFDIEVLLSDRGEVISTAKLSGRKAASVLIRDAFKEYTPEKPYVYDLFVRVRINGKEVECVRFPVAFCDLTLDPKGLLLSGRPFTVRAAEYDFAASEDVKADFAKMKYLRLNTLVVDNPTKDFLYECLFGGFFVIQKLDASKKSFAQETVSLDGVNKYFKWTYACLVDKTSPVCSLLWYLAVNYSRAADAIDDVCARTRKRVLGYDEYITLVRGGDDRPDEQFTYYTDMVGDIDALGQFDSRLVVGGTLGSFEKDLSADGVWTEWAIAIRRSACAVHASLRDNRRLEIFNDDYFIDQKGSVDAQLVFGTSSQFVKHIDFFIGARNSSVYELLIDKIAPDMVLQLIYRDEEKRLLTVENLPVLYGRKPNDDASYLRCGRYSYDLRALGEDVAEENVMPARSYFVPCTSEAVSESSPSYSEQRKHSDRVSCLAGQWQFAYLGETLPSSFVPMDREWDTIDLPSSWEEKGYETLAYHDKYPFAFDKKTFRLAPDAKNTFGVYRKVVNVVDLTYRYVLSLEGVSGGLTVYVNGNYVGGSSCPSAQFDLTDYVVVGENEIVLLLQKWTKTSLLSGKGFAATGLLGEIDFIKRRKECLYDYSYTVDKAEDRYYVNLNLQFEESPENVHIALKQNGRKYYEDLKKGAKNVDFHFSGKFEASSTENPVMYDVLVKVFDRGGFVIECTDLKLDIRSTRTESGALCLNDIPVKVRGVVYNPVYNAYGGLMGREERKNDVDLIKRYGFNAIYPTFEPSCEFLRICAEKGLYVIYRIPLDFSCYRKADERGENALLADPDMQERVRAIIDGTVERTKAFHNILMYVVDVGKNEFIGQVVKECRQKTVSYVASFGDNQDVVLLRKPSIKDLLDAINENMNKKPVFMTEFGTQAGVGNTDIPQYDSLIAESACCMGGCIEQFVDEATNDMLINDNGLFSKARTACAGAESVMYCYRPIRADLVESKRLRITNKHSYINTSDYAIFIALQRNGKILSRTELTTVIPPMSDRDFDIFVDHPSGDMFINAEVCDRKTKRILYVEQIRLSEQLQTINQTEPRGAFIRTNDMPDYLDIAFDGGTMRFDKRIGSLTRYVVMGKEILKADSLAKGFNAFRTEIYRPFMRNILRGGDPFTTEIRDFSWEKEDDKISVLIENTIYWQNKESYVVQDKYLIAANGEIEVFSVINPMRRNLPMLDCFGKRLRLHNSFGNVTYYGYGDIDNYVDMNNHTRIGQFGLNVDKVFDSVTLKQECGNRQGVHYVIALDGEGDGIVCAAKQDPFCLRVSPLSDKEIETCVRERCDKKQSGVYLDIDAFVSGIGTSNQGYPLGQYMYPPKQYSLHFSIIPVYKSK